MIRHSTEQSRFQEISGKYCGDKYCGNIVGTEPKFSESGFGFQAGLYYHKGTKERGLGFGRLFLRFSLVFPDRGRGQALCPPIKSRACFVVQRFFVSLRMVELHKAAI